MEKLPFGLSTEGFDGSAPFATIEVWDPGFNDSLAITCRTPEDFLANWTRTTNVIKGEQQTWAGKYLFHATGRPAIKFFNGNQAWFKNGQLHNEVGPALEFGGQNLYALGGQLVPENLFSDYLIYLDRLEKFKPPAGSPKIPTFPNKYEIKTANKYGLFLLFDYDLNYYWMDDQGRLHHPTEPAYQGFNGMVQHWNHGALVSERFDSEFRNGTLDQVRKEIEEMTKCKFETAADVIAALDREDLRGLFEEAGRMFEAGYGLDEIGDWFGRAYGDGWPHDFSKSLMDDFKGMVEEVVEHMEGSANAFKRVMPVKIITGQAEGPIIKRGVVPEPVDLPPLESEEESLAEWQKRVDNVLQAAQKMSQKNGGKVLENIAKAAGKIAPPDEGAPMPRLTAEAALEAITKMAKAIEEKGGFPDATGSRDKKITDVVSQAEERAWAQLIGKLEAVSAEGEGRLSQETSDEAKAKLIRAAERLEKAAEGKAEQAMLPESTGQPVNDPEAEKPESGWALPLGALAVAGLVGFLGSREKVAVREPEIARAEV